VRPYAFGVDIGGTTIKLGLFKTDGTLLEKWEIPTRTESDGANILPDIAKAITQKMEEREISSYDVKGIGIDVPGPVSSDGTVFKCVNLGWGVFNVVDRMNDLLPSVPNVACGNDANVAALGEMWMGGGRGHENVAMFTLGTGVGGGIVLGGKIVAGANGAGGEVGHMCVNPEETVPCACGNRGCLEQYASANGIVRMGKLMMAESDTASPLKAMANVTAKDICDAARAGDELAMEILDRCGEYLGRAMSAVSATLDPEIYVVGGGMSRAGAVLIDAIVKYFERYAFHVSKKTPIVVAELGNDAGIYGCAKMIL
jgi:glucokinase